MKALSKALVFALPVVLFASSLSAQWISFGLRGTGSIPTGSFAEDPGATSNTALIDGAKNGFGFGLDASVGVGMLGIYAGFDHVKFDCETATCKADGTYTLQGATVGVKISPLTTRFRPFVKGGITFNDLKGGYGGSSSNSLSTDKTPGYEVGAGIDLSLMGLVSVTPQVRYIGQNLKARIPGVATPATATEQGVKYFSFDLGLSVHTPFGMR
ncbi:MAG: outer membrane beta-barrel protein [bacterium]